MGVNRDKDPAEGRRGVRNGDTPRKVTSDPDRSGEAEGQASEDEAHLGAVDDQPESRR